MSETDTLFLPITQILPAGFSAGFLPVGFLLTLRLRFCKLPFASAFSYADRQHHPSVIAVHLK